MAIPAVRAHADTERRPSASVIEQQFHLDQPQIRGDAGLFGPESVSWKVWSHPAVLPGVARSFVLDMVGSAHAAAALEEHSRYREDPLGRFNRTLHYFLTLVFADTATVAAANQRLDRMHARITGTEPLSGEPYSALDPYLRLGNHLLTWHSVFYAYDRLAGGLSPADEAAFFQESATAFESLGIEREAVIEAAARHGIPADALEGDLPSTRDEYRRMWEASRHLVCVTKQTRGALDAILHPAPTSATRKERALLAAYPALARAGLALIPREIRHTCGLPTSPRMDAVAISGARLVTRGVQASGTYPRLLRAISPHGELVQREALAWAGSSSERGR